jgi:hypothetical protein
VPFVKVPEVAVIVPVMFASVAPITPSKETQNFLLLIFTSPTPSAVVGA